MAQGRGSWLFDRPARCMTRAVGAMGAGRWPAGVLSQCSIPTTEGSVWTKIVTSHFCSPPSPLIDPADSWRFQRGGSARRTSAKYRRLHFAKSSTTPRPCNRGERLYAPSVGDGNGPQHSAWRLFHTPRCGPPPAPRPYSAWRRGRER